MVWYKEKKIIFIHIPNTGGDNIEKYFDLQKNYIECEKIKKKHLTGVDYKVLLNDDFNKFFKFSIVRDPIERMISEYYLNKLDGYQNKKSFDQFLDNIEEKLKENIKIKKILKNDNTSKTILSVTKYVQPRVIEKYKFNTYLNEKKWLTILKDTDIIAKPIYFDDKNKMIITEYAGEKINKFNIPNDYKQQINNILNILEANNCRHNDIKPEELLVLNGKIRIIDFGWAYELNQDNPDYWPKSLGGKFKCDRNLKEINYDKCTIDKCLNYILNDNNYLSQTSFIYDKNNKLMVDKIFKFENYKEIEKFLLENYKNENSKIILKNFKSIKNEDRINLSVEQKARIYYLYKEDFINFNYNLDVETLEYIRNK